MLRVLSFVVLSFFLTFQGHGQQLWIEVQNLNSSGPGSLTAAADSLATAPFFAAGYLKFADGLSGEVTLTSSLRVQNMNSFTFKGSPTVDIKFQTSDTAIVISNIDIATISDCISTSNALVVMRDCDITSVRFCDVKWLYYFKENDISSVEGGSSYGINSYRVSDIRSNEHRVGVGNYLINVQDTRINNAQYRRVLLTNNKIGLQTNNVAYPVSYWGIKLFGCQDTDIDITGNEIVFIAKGGLGDTIGDGINIRDCTGNINVKGNYFGTDSSLVLHHSVNGDGLVLENISNCSAITIDSNFFYGVGESAIELKNVNDTASIANNKIMFDLTGASFDQAVYIDNSSELTFTGNEIGSSFKNAVYLTNSTKNYFKNNMIGLIDDGQSTLTSLKGFKSGVYIDSLSTGNVFKENYIVRQANYGFENHGGSNNIAVNFVACNDTGNFYYKAINPTYEAAIKGATLTLNVDAQGKLVSLVASNLNLPNGFVAHIYKKITCSTYTKASVQKAYVDSMVINNGTGTYSFPVTASNFDEDIQREQEDTYYLMIVDQSHDLIGVSGNSVKSTAVSVSEVKTNFRNAYPNPTTSIVTVSEPVVGVYNNIGHLVQLVSSSSLQVKLTVVPGVYSIRYKSGKQEVIIVQ